MGTHGCWGFRLDGKEKLTYNHYDSYPDGLGKDLVTALHASGPAVLTKMVKKLKLVNGTKKPTKPQQKKLEEYFDNSVSTGQPDEWYALLRNTQGDLEKTLGCGYMIDDHTFLLDSLFCEWAYVINLDDGVLEVYEGFQEVAHTKGRYAEDLTYVEDRNTADRKAYYPVALISTFALDALPSPEEFVREVDARIKVEDGVVEVPVVLTGSGLVKVRAGSLEEAVAAIQSSFGARVTCSSDIEMDWDIPTHLEVKTI